jgi:hypothetical protein
MTCRICRQLEGGINDDLKHSPTQPSQIQPRTNRDASAKYTTQPTPLDPRSGMTNLGARRWKKAVEAEDDDQKQNITTEDVVVVKTYIGAALATRWGEGGLSSTQHWCALRP